MDDKINYYQQLYNAFKIAYPKDKGFKGQETQNKTNKFWNSNKKDLNVIKSKIIELKTKAQKFQKYDIISAFKRGLDKEKTGQDKSQIENIDIVVNESQDSPQLSNSTLTTTITTAIELNTRPAQNKHYQKIEELNNEILRITRVKEIGLATLDDTKQLSKLKTNRAIEERKLKALINASKRMKNYRSNQKKKLKTLCTKHPDIIKELDLQPKPVGRPRLEEGQPGILETIINIAMNGSAADNRRRTELIRTCKTLSDLNDSLRSEGFEISRSATYIRLLPRRCNTTEGKRHVKTVPVKLSKPQNIGRCKHEDSDFAMAGINYLKELAVILGNGPVFFISQDDKARVPIGIPAANKQAPLLMHLDYVFKLPDHDFVVAQRHKLIPSVYAACEVLKDKISYSGPTYIAIRSGKHDSSTSQTHAFDFRTLTGLEEFDKFLKNDKNEIKPVIIITVDGGPDENPRYPKTLVQIINHFKEFNLDAIFVATHAPGQSAYNAVERRMAPLSRDLTGLVLPHEYYGSHLNNSGITIDHRLEKLNFQRAGETLSKVWSETVIDSYPVISNYIEPNTGLNIVNEFIDENWKSIHVRQSQYCLQVVKCFDSSCCRDFRSNLIAILPDRFIPPPVPFVNDEMGPQIGEIKTGQFSSLLLRLSLKLKLEHEFKHLPFDYYCPSVHDTLSKKICKICGLYCLNGNYLKLHQKSKCETGLVFDESAQNEDVSMDGDNVEYRNALNS